MLLEWREISATGHRSKNEFDCFFISDYGDYISEQALLIDAKEGFIYESF